MLVRKLEVLGPFLTDFCPKPMHVLELWSVLLLLSTDTDIISALWDLHQRVIGSDHHERLPWFQALSVAFLCSPFLLLIFSLLLSGRKVSFLGGDIRGLVCIYLVAAEHIGGAGLLLRWLSGDYVLAWYVSRVAAIVRRRLLSMRFPPRRRFGALSLLFPLRSIPHFWFYSQGVFLQSLG